MASWWFQPIWKNISQIRLIFPTRDENSKKLETTT